MTVLFRRLLATAVATAAMAAAVVVTTASPAQAIANPVVVSASSLLGSPANALATANCPAGTTVVGGGGQIVGPAGLVTLTRVIPDVATNSVTAWGVEAGAGTGLNWVVQAIATCDTVIAGVVRVSVVSAFDAATPKTVQPQCPVGTYLTGIGYELANGGGDVFPDDVTPNAVPDGATLTAFDSGPAGNWSITGYALCAPLPAGAAVPVLRFAATPFNAVASKSITSPNCPAGTRAVGAGGEMTGALGNAILTNVAPNGIATRANAGAEAYNGFAGGWRLEVFAICW
jgi:hypothetical protein